MYLMNEKHTGLDDSVHFNLDNLRSTQLFIFHNLQENAVILTELNESIL